jgi:hypothetical protein
VRAGLDVVHRKLRATASTNTRRLLLITTSKASFDPSTNNLRTPATCDGELCFTSVIDIVSIVPSRLGQFGVSLAQHSLLGAAQPQHSLITASTIRHGPSKVTVRWASTASYKSEAFAFAFSFAPAFPRKFNRLRSWR